tara:strand:- start:730 stop:1095 length:366 start_codon:yes stop_codon:yes gene_type:complete
MYEWWQKLQYRTTTGTLSDQDAFLKGAVVAIICLVMLNIYVRMEMGKDDKTAQMWYKKMTMMHIVGIVILAGGLSVISNRITGGNYEAKKKVYEEQGLSEDTALITSSISRGGTSMNFGRR